ncbi:hypothetical protein [Stappia indica]|uniref:hypothetical protein n=1 Tax=Stappia indica TaxID=538381 RepID=UPI0011126697|nr:hypothetical protein [Stappia indica]
MLRAMLSLVFLAVSGVCAQLYYSHHFKWRDCFNELGRCYDPETGVVYLEQGGAVWLALAISAFAMAAYHAWRWTRR